MSTITFSNDSVELKIRTGCEGGAALDSILPKNAKDGLRASSPHFENSSLPLVNVRLSNEGNPLAKSGQNLVGSYTTSRLEYVSHNESAGKGSKTLGVVLKDPQSKISVTAHVTIYDGSPFVRSTASIKNNAEKDITVTQLTSVVIGGATEGTGYWNEYEVSYANSTWFREAQWQTYSPTELGISDFGIHELPDTHTASMASFSLCNRSSFGTEGHLPMGMIKRKNGRETWMWQIESNGYWRWDIGDWKDSLFIAAGGPDGSNHEWRQRLTPGAEFTTCPVGFCHIFDDTEAAFSALTHYRRRIRRDHPDSPACPIIFNDYMNCLMGDPTEEKILALLDPVAKSGAEYFVIDCGWYADDMGWWYDVGLWEPSKKRFPNGFKNLLDKIRAKGLKPGLWVETEVVGFKSVVADRLPHEAFFQRDGERILEKGRYQLDYRHPEVTKWMDSVIDNLVQNYGAKYFKFDYNIQVVAGTDVNASSAGAGAFEHGRAYLRWINGLLDRYPDLVLENCSSGAQRMEYAMLSCHQLQSTSDQQDPVRYAAIAAGVPTAVAPEQSATWAYPQGDWSDEVNAMTVINSLLGRIHLSGRLDQMSAKQLDIIYEGMQVYQAIRGDIPAGTPFWPLGLPKWDDRWIALGLRSGDGKRRYVSVWRRGGEETKMVLPVPALKGKSVDAKMLYPKSFEGKGTWDAGAGALEVELPKTVCARLFKLETA